MKLKSHNREWHRVLGVMFTVFFMAVIFAAARSEYTARAAGAQCKLVYKINGNYVMANVLGNASYEKIERNKEFYLEYQIEAEKIAGSTVRTYIRKEAGGADTISTVKCVTEGKDYYYDTEEGCAYIPVSLKNEQGSIKLYFDLTLANGETVETYDPESNDAFYLELLGEYTISYDANGGTGEPKTQVKYTESPLILSSVEPSREGYLFKGWSASSYAQTASYQPGDEYTQNGNVTLYAIWEVDLRPVVSVPSDQNVKTGESAYFEVTAEGDYEDYYTFQWYVADSQDGLGVEIEEATSLSYYLSEEQVTPELDGNYYYCVVRDTLHDYEVPSGRARLTVYSAPAVAAPLEQKVKAGESAVFHVAVTGGNPVDYTYQWYYAAAQNGAGIKIDGAVSANYTVPGSQVTAGANGRYYYCEVGNGQYSVVSGRAQLTVYTPPTVVSSSSTTVKAGESVTFLINVTGGNPTNYTFQWYYAVSGAGTGTKIAGATSSSYTVPGSQVTASINGRYYYCVVSNGIYEVAGSRAMLTVQSITPPPANNNQTSTPNNNTDTPPIVKKTQKITASSYTREYGSKSFTLKASTNGDGKLSYVSSNPKVAKISAKGKVSVKKYGTAVITIRASETANYKSAKKQVKIKVVPKKTAIAKAVSPAERKIEITWKKNKKAQGYELHISAKKNFKSYTLRRKFDKKKSRVVMTGLSSKKTYYVRLRSYVKVGKTKYYSSWSKTKKVKVK